MASACCLSFLPAGFPLWLVSLDGFAHVVADSQAPVHPGGRPGRVRWVSECCSRSPAPWCSAPRQARAFFEALVANNLDLGRPKNEVSRRIAAARLPAAA